MILNIDIAPTLYELAGVEVPIPIHGKSLVPVLQDPSHKLRTEFLAEYYLEKITPLYATWQAVRSDKWKYIRYPELSGMDELYNLQDDLGELKNLYHSPGHQSRIREMQVKLKQLLEDSQGVY